MQKLGGSFDQFRWDTTAVLAKYFTYVREQNVTVQSWVNDRMRGTYSYRGWHNDIKWYPGSPEISLVVITISCLFLCVSSFLACRIRVMTRVRA